MRRRHLLLLLLLLLPLATTLRSPPPRAVALSPPQTTATPPPATPAKWHLNRRAAILREHPEISKLIGREPLTLPALAFTNIAQIGCAVALSDLPTPALTVLAIFLGGTLSLWQFALLHDVKHGTAALPKGVRPDDVLFVGSLPSLFGYYLYLRYGHLTHHKDFGRHPIKTLFDSEQSVFEDGDALFIAHRQQMAKDKANGEERIGFFGNDKVGGLGLSISRTIYSLLWLDLDGSGKKRTSSSRDGNGGEADDTSLQEWLPAIYHALVFAFSMSFERAALVFGGGVVPAIVGRNYFFPNKPDDFHSTCTTYARTSLLLAAVIFLAAGNGSGALTWLFWAEVGWQLPIHPASAMFVSNHPSLESEAGGGVSGTSDGGGGASCQPTASVYLNDWYDWLCCFSNFHTEHHDFPDVPAFRLKQLRDLAPEFYSEAALKGCRDGWLETMRRTFAGRGFYACAGVLRDESEIGESQ